jgi:hypothetical protein
MRNMQRLVLSFYFFCSASVMAAECSTMVVRPRPQAVQNGKHLGKVMTDKSKIPHPHDEADMTDMPSVVGLTDEQKLYLIQIFCAVVAIIEGKTQLEVEEDRLLGTGQFFWPKDPTKPAKLAKSYFGSNFRMSGIALRFERKSEDSPWIKAGLSVHPANFPIGVYEMSLPLHVFDDFLFVKAVPEIRPEESVKKPIVFYFLHRKLPGVKLRVESRDDVVCVGGPYPSSFHAFEITRDPNR